MLTITLSNFEFECIRNGVTNAIPTRRSKSGGKNIALEAGYLDPKGRGDLAALEDAIRSRGSIPVKVAFKCSMRKVATADCELHMNELYYVFHITKITKEA